MSTIKNPLLAEYNTPYGVPPFDQIKAKHFMPAINAAIEEQNKNIQSIVENSAEPTFQNTIEAFETSGERLAAISLMLDNFTSAIIDDSLLAVSKEAAPLLSGHNDDILMNEKLFLKIKNIYDKRESLGLTSEQLMLIDNTYKSFVRGGANLASAQKDSLKAINQEMSLLFITFTEHVLAENNRFQLVIDNQADLDGLPQTAIESAAKTATEKGLDGKWVFTIQKPSLLPFLENAKNRSLREKIFKAYINKGDNNDSLDNKKVLVQIIQLRNQKAKLLGFPTYAAYVLDRNMAKNADNVYDLLNKLIKPALKVAKQEVADMQKIVDKEKGGFKIAAWDYWYYAAKVKEQKYSLNENDVKPYLKLESVRDGMFWVANQLYGVTFTKLDSMPVYHPDCEVYKVEEENGELTGILYLDYFTRESKRGGAWCTGYRDQLYKDGKRIAPVVSMVCNFSPSTSTTPSLLSMDDAETIFHEFGHALDGLFDNKHYASLVVPRDFVELPSQIMENWAFAPAVLKHYAKHYQTGEPMPDALIAKIEKAGKFNQGFATTEYLAASFLDMDWHTKNIPADVNVDAFEKESMNKINLIDAIVPRYRSTYFNHIFADNGYATGYYSYIWAEVLDADAFESFVQNGLFDKTTASAFRTNVLELGGTDDAMKLYKNFKGAEPKIEALLKRRGLN